MGLAMRRTTTTSPLVVNGAGFAARAMRSGGTSLWDFLGVEIPKERGYVEGENVAIEYDWAAFAAIAHSR
jgi:hypothetical protein